MKTRNNNIRFMMLLAFVAIAMTAWSQRPNVEKMSVTTQMLLDQMEEIVVTDQTYGPTRQPDLNLEELDQHRILAKPELIDGQVYMSAFVRIVGDDVIDQLTGMGVKIQSRFDNGLVTALIPVEKIEEVAALDGVKKINAAESMRPLTDKAREATNVDDVLTNSADAIAAGLNDVYDGSGVILGIIDTGIDYQHITFQGTNGTRIKRIYNYTYTQTDYYGRPTDATETEWTGTGTMPTTDDNTEDHGTHTSSTAGGSSVIINGSNVTVTDDHAAATYGGMAPGADLYLAGIKDLNSTYLANAFQKMSDYADQQNKPLVVNNSWGSQMGPHDGTGYFAEIVAMYFGDNNPNKICLFASSNDGGNSKDGEGGGYHVKGTATSAQPLSTILRSSTYSDTDAGYFYQGILASAWARNTGVTKMGVKIFVLDANTGAVKTSVTVTNQTTSVSGLGSYYNGTLSVYYDQVESDKTQIVLYSSGGLTTRGSSTVTQNGSTYYKSNYTLAVQFYPISGSNNTVIDVWGGTYGYFTNHLTTNGYNWTDGSDDMSVSDEATIPDAISIGAYSTKNQITDYTGATYNYAYTVGDIAGFSSYATAEESPTGLQYPWITAPGARLVAAVNHLHNQSSDQYNYINGNYGKIDRVNTNTTYPYGAMQGTSMATPVAAGIVALWLQAAQEVGMTMTTSDIKEVMRETAIIDDWTTTGPNASHFGNGKINALAGIEYILGGNTPSITAIPTEVTFDGEPGNSYTSTVVVKGRKLIGNITATLTDGNGVYSINETNLGQGGDLIITFAPTVEGDYTASVTLTSPGAEPVTITITGRALIHMNVLNSNHLVVPVYHSEAQAHDATYVFTRSQVDDDTDMSLSYNGNAAVKVNVLAKNDEPIVSYDLHHKVGSGDWTYPNGEAVASAIQQNDPNTYVVNQETFTIPQDATEMWLQLIDKSVDANSTIYYVPVTVADGVITQGNTYGAPLVQVDRDNAIDMDVIITGSKSDKRLGGHWKEARENDTDYCVYTIVSTIMVNDNFFNSDTRMPYMFRAWLIPNDHIHYYDFKRNEDGAIVGDTLLTGYKLLGEYPAYGLDSNGPFTIGFDYDKDNANGPNPWGEKLQNSFAAPSNMNAEEVTVAVRAYYLNVDGLRGGDRRGMRDGDGEAPDDGYGMGQGQGSSTRDGIVTSVAGIYTDRQVVAVMYVNPQGMQSERPFDGVNIIVTRYSDGSVTTTKVVK